MSTLHPPPAVYAPAGTPPGDRSRALGESPWVPDRLHPLRWPAILGFWFLFWLLNAAAHVSKALWFNPMGNRDVSVGYLLEEAVTATIWALFTPLILLLSRRVPVNVRNWRGRVPLHLGFAFGFIALYSFLRFAWHNHFYPPSGRHPFPWSAFSEEILVREYHRNVLVYFGILITGLAVQYYHDLQRQQLAAARLQTRLSEARLQTLRMQLHPHFLFNTLNTISNLTERDPRDARRVIARLGELLRRALESTQEHEVTLGEELRFARGYLDIVRARFGDRLRLEFDIAPGLEDALVPNLILQPVLENAVEHGIAKSFRAGSIGVCAERQGNRLALRVSDDGPGIPESGMREGVGLQNTRARLEQLYGPAGELRLRNGDGAGLTAEVVLPYHSSAPASVTSANGLPESGAR